MYAAVSGSKPDAFPGSPEPEVWGAVVDGPAAPAPAAAAVQAAQGAARQFASLEGI